MIFSYSENLGKTKLVKIIYFSNNNNLNNKFFFHKSIFSKTAQVSFRFLYTPRSNYRVKKIFFCTLHAIGTKCLVIGRSALFLCFINDTWVCEKGCWRLYKSYIPEPMDKALNDIRIKVISIRATRKM